MIPGRNILNLALGVITKQTVVYYRAIGRTLNNVGQEVTSFSQGENLQGSFQPLSRRLYEQYGLDLQKTYYRFFVSADVIDVTRDVSGDQIQFDNKVFQVESNKDWYALDGWKGILCVLIDEINL